MIYTVTFNPSLDYIVTVDDFKPGQVNRATEEVIYPGGKGINVSIVLRNLGFDNTALGFLAGFTGTEIENMLKKQGINAEFIHIGEGISRINMKLRSNEESEINGQGPAISIPDIQNLYKKLDELKDDDVLVLAGSIPSTMPESIYMDIMKHLQKRKIKIVVDATNDLLMNVMQYHPFLIKPNNHELGEIFGVELQKKEDVIPYAKKLQDRGAKNVLVATAGEGAVLVTEQNEVFQSEAPKGTVINSVGAGDSMVAGFLAGFLKTGDYRVAFKMGIATGSASAFSEKLATKGQVEQILKNHAFTF